MINKSEYYEVMEDEIKIFARGVKYIIKTSPKDKKMTQADLAKKIGKDQSTISGYINGRTRPGVKEIEAITKALGMTYEEIIEAGRIVDSDFKDDIIKILREQLNISVLPQHREHHKIIEQFKDKPFATKINIALVELEDLDRDSLEEVYEIIQGKLRRLRPRLNRDKTGTHGGNQ